MFLRENEAERQILLICTALLKITEDWREALDERQTVSAVSIDLSKAFDTICHCLLIRKLAAYVASGPLHSTDPLLPY